MASRHNFPPGHVVAIAYVRLFGPKMSQTPSGHPIQIGTAPFDNTVETAVHAIAQVAAKRMGIVPNESDWLLDFEEDVIPVPGQPAPPYSKVYYFVYTHADELARWKRTGLEHATLHNPLKESHYLTKHHLHRKADHTSATTLKAATTTQEAKS